MSHERVRAWLEACGFGAYADTFEREGVTFDTLPALTDGDLRDLGISRVGDRVAFRAALDGLVRSTGSALPRAFGPWQVLERAGTGGMGTVYKARRADGTLGAVKVLHPQLASNDAVVARFRREAEALLKLDHPNIVKAIDLVEEAGAPVLVLEWVPGRALSHVIGRETGPIPWERARPMVDQLLAAVAHAHARGVIHRDLKPANVQVTPDGRLKVLDFGIARTADGPRHTQTGTGLGTLDYMAPEQFTAASRVDARADVHALGMTLYEMLAGRLPWEPSATEYEVMEAKARGDVPPPTRFYPAIPPWVEAAVMRCLRVRPEERPGSVEALAAALAGEAASADEDTDPGAARADDVLAAGMTDHVGLDWTPQQHRAMAERVALDWTPQHRWFPLTTLPIAGKCALAGAGLGVTFAMVRDSVDLGALPSLVGNGALFGVALAADRALRRQLRGHHPFEQLVRADAGTFACHVSILLGLWFGLGLWEGHPWAQMSSAAFVMVALPVASARLLTHLRDERRSANAFKLAIAGVALIGITVLADLDRWARVLAGTGYGDLTIERIQVLFGIALTLGPWAYLFRLALTDADASRPARRPPARIALALWWGRASFAAVLTLYWLRLCLVQGSMILMAPVVAAAWLPVRLLASIVRPDGRRPSMPWEVPDDEVLYDPCVADQERLLSLEADVRQEPTLAQLTRAITRIAAQYGLDRIDADTGELPPSLRRLCTLVALLDGVALRAELPTIRSELEAFHRQVGRLPASSPNVAETLRALDQIERILTKR